MTEFLIYGNALLFLLLSLLHIFWAFGGRLGYASSLPTLESGKPVFQPGFFACIIVAFGLLAFSLSMISALPDALPPASKTFSKMALYFISFLFLVRAIGERKYVGLFRKVSQTNFGKMDRKYYTPLCLYLAFSTVWIAFFS